LVWWHFVEAVVQPGLGSKGALAWGCSAGAIRHRYRQPALEVGSFSPIQQ
jgi:hypothetical protein